MVRLGDRHAAQQVRVDFVSRRSLARAGARNQGFKPHKPHQPRLRLTPRPSSFRSNVILREP